jgi:hypothetical protein
LIYDFRGKRLNVTNKGSSEADIFAPWDAALPNDPVEV